MINTWAIDLIYRSTTCSLLLSHFFVPFSQCKWQASSKTWVAQWWYRAGLWVIERQTSSTSECRVRQWWMRLSALLKEIHFDCLRKLGTAGILSGLLPYILQKQPNCSFPQLSPAILLKLSSLIVKFSSSCSLLVPQAAITPQPGDNMSSCSALESHLLYCSLVTALM